MSSWKIDPRNGDYIMKNGKPIPTDDLSVPAYYRIKIPRGNWMYAPDNKYGSDLATLKKKAGNAAVNMMQQACQPIIDDGRALAVNVTLDQPQPNSRNSGAVTVAITDSDGTPNVLNLPPVGD